MELCWVDEGAVCANGHFVSGQQFESLPYRLPVSSHTLLRVGEMLAQHVRHLSEEGAGKHCGRVRCPTFQCSSEFDAQVCLLNFAVECIHVARQLS
jgi:hypothetical protein